jgi:hypothetical protein
MKIKLPEIKPYPQDGTIRYKAKFLWFPVVINNELRWLEEAIWEEKSWRGHSGGSYWEKTKWIDLTEEEKAWEEFNRDYVKYQDEKDI